MRLAVFIAALACASAAQAEGARENRYGPAPARAPAALDSRAPLFNGATYSTRTLGWTGKRDAVTEAVASSAPQPWWVREQAQTETQTQAPPPRMERAAPIQASVPAPVARAPAALPQSIFDAPAPAPVAAATPTQTAMAAPPMQPGYVGARTYSVGRQFGMTPDPIPAAGPSRMVLISAPPAPSEDEPKPGVQEGGEWSGRAEKDGKL